MKDLIYYLYGNCKRLRKIRGQIIKIHLFLIYKTNYILYKVICKNPLKNLKIDIKETLALYMK